jgi:hypothetical protein
MQAMSMNRTTNQNKSRVLRVDNEAAANDGNRIRNILIFDNHPASLRLVRELYGDSAEPPLSQYYPLIIALVILGVAVVIVWFR